MRAGGNCAVQQALTAESLGVLKQAITLARRRGHAQVTPLHVANTMLASPTGFLKTACLQSQSHSHPLQCKALELCFNVALNRLPTSSSVSPMLATHGHNHNHNYNHNHPTVSNALVAAFKRAQAHQRRGSIESQQQPILAVKIELEQLIISILDDPSVSRVMREAGFSSTQVKSSVEKSVSLMESTPSSNKFKESRPKASNLVKDEDLTVLIDNMISTNKRSTKNSIVIVGEWIENIEGVVGALMDKFDRGEVPQDLKEMKFISLPLYSIENRSREEVEKKLVELRCLVKSCVEKGVVLYLGDLKWTADFRVKDDDDSNEVGRVRNCYCPVEHMVIELGRLIRGIGDSGNFWLLAISTFQTFMRCKKGNPSLEAIWGLHPLTIPQGSLGLSLVPTEREANINIKGGNNHDKHQATFCTECSSNFEAEARILKNSDSTTVSTLPPWLQLSKENNQHPNKDLFKKWSSYCKSLHKQPNLLEMAMNSSSISASSSPSGYLCDLQTNPSSYEWRDRPFIRTQERERELSIFRSMQGDQYVQNGIFSNTNSTNSSDVIMETNEYVKSFKELTSHNINMLCNALENKVPWQKDIVAPIASTILQCRSGNVRRKGSVAKRDGEFNGRTKEETWLLFQGLDLDGKEKLSRELARVIFGSQSNLVTISLSSFSSTRVDLIEDSMIRNKRLRVEESSSYLERFAEAVASNPHRVFFVEDVEQADYSSQMGIKRAIESGWIKSSSRREVSLSDAIVILSCETLCLRSSTCSSPTKQKFVGDGLVQEEEMELSLSLDLNISCDDHEYANESKSMDDIELFEFVDRQIVFKDRDL
ncbi:protein SMAX1-LIKE 3 [Impatiens glandulifera]|uniref:protein SMAX1-LIKE 3 n=1 Tax=Impatiens glandulifera TaxID=253017 RepID=UPI001FB14703|nr:protein SMAX1-LIKE 3 [Impatiens glandulifera]